MSHLILVPQELSNGSWLWILHKFQEAWSIGNDANLPSYNVLLAGIIKTASKPIPQWEGYLQNTGNRRVKKWGILAECQAPRECSLIFSTNVKQALANFWNNSRPLDNWPIKAVCCFLLVKLVERKLVTDADWTNANNGLKNAVETMKHLAPEEWKDWESCDIELPAKFSKLFNNFGPFYTYDNPFDINSTAVQILTGKLSSVEDEEKHIRTVVEESMAGCGEWDAFGLVPADAALKAVNKLHAESRKQLAEGKRFLEQAEAKIKEFEKEKAKYLAASKYGAGANGMSAVDSFEMENSEAEN